jgi:hypothetical protein
LPVQQLFQSAGERSLPEPCVRGVGGAVHGDSRIQIICHLCTLFIGFAIEIPSKKHFLFSTCLNQRYGFA